MGLFRALFVVLALVVCSGVTDASSSASVVLTVDNYQKVTEGRNVFIKFYAPWCGHCKALAPDWEKLAKDWVNHDITLIGEVDCTDQGGEPLCEQFLIQGFPTILFGDPTGLEEYEGGRSYEDLSKFTKEHLQKPICSVSDTHVQHCTEAQQRVIAKLKQMTADDLVRAVTEVDEKLKKVQAEFDAYVDSLNDQYENQVSILNERVDQLRLNNNLKFVQQVLRTKHGVDPSTLMGKANGIDDMEDDDDDDDNVGGEEL